MSEPKSEVIPMNSSRYFLAPVGYKTPRQFDEANTPAIYLMPEGHIVYGDGIGGNNNVCIQDFIALMAWHWVNDCYSNGPDDKDLRPCFDSMGQIYDSTRADGLEPIASVIEEAMQMICGAIEKHAPTIYPVETNPADSKKE